MQNKTTYRLFEDKVDKLVHDRFTMAEVPVTTNEWDSLQQRLLAHQNKNKTKRNTLWGLGIGLLLLLGTATILLNKKSATTNNDTVTANHKKSNKTEVHPHPETTNNKNTSENPAQKATASLPQTIASTTPTFKEYNTINRPSGNKQTIQPPVLKLNNIGSVTGKENQNVQKNIEEPLVVTYGFNTKNKKTSQDREATIKEVVENSKESKEKEAITIEKNAKETADISKQLLEKPLNNIAEPEQEIRKDNMLPDNNQDMHKTVAVAKVKMPKVKKVKKERAIPEHNFRQEKQWFVEAYSGLTNSNKNRNSFAAFLAPSGYMNKRLNQETNLNSMQAGVQFKMRKNHLIVSGGVSYLQLGDKINYDSAGTGSFALQANGNTNFTYMEIPITAGYEWANKRWGFSLQAGLSAGILMNLSGQYVSIDNFNTNLFDVKANKSNFKKSIYNVIVNPQMNYFINDRMNIFAAPVYRRNLQPITVTNADLQQRYSSLGIQIGIRTRL